MIFCIRRMSTNMQTEIPDAVTDLHPVLVADNSDVFLNLDLDFASKSLSDPNSDAHAIIRSEKKLGKIY